MGRASAVTVERSGTRASVLRRVWDAIEDRPLVALFLIAVIVRLLLVALSGLFEGFVLDDGTYHQMAMDMASGDISHWDDFTYSLFWRTASFLGPVALLYKLFGPHIVVGQVLVAFIGAASVVVVTRLALEFLSIRWTVIVGLLLALLPSQAFWSAQLMKDASVWLALSGLALVIAIANRSTGRRLVVAGLGAGLILCALAFLREHTLVVAAWATMVASLAGIPRARLARIGGAIVLGVTIPWAVAAIGPAGLDLVTNAGSLQEIRFKMAQGANTAVVDTTPGGTEAELNQIILARQEMEADITRLESLAADAQAEAGQISAEIRAAEDPQERQTALRERRDLRERARRERRDLRERARRERRDLRERAREVQEELAAARGQVAALLVEQARIQTPPPGAELSKDEGSLDPNIAHLPRGLSVILVEPFPVPFTGSSSLRLARLESLIWYPLLVLAAIGLWPARRYLRQVAFPLLAGTGVMVMYALSEGNVGTAHRHRGEFVWVVALFAAIGLSHLVARRQGRPQEDV